MATCSESPRSKIASSYLLSSPSLPSQLLFSESPPKRRGSPLTSDAKRKREDSRNVTLSSRARIERIGNFPTKQSRYEAALDAARVLDTKFGLLVEDAMVISRVEPPSSQSEIFDHTNHHDWEVLELQAAALQLTVSVHLRCFMDAFYHFCGFRPIWKYFTAGLSNAGVGLHPLAT